MNKRADFPPQSRASSRLFIHRKMVRLFKYIRIQSVNSFSVVIKQLTHIFYSHLLIDIMRKEIVPHCLSNHKKGAQQNDMLCGTFLLSLLSWCELSIVTTSIYVTSFMIVLSVIPSFFSYRPLSPVQADKIFQKHV